MIKNSKNGIVFIIGIVLTFLTGCSLKSNINETKSNYYIQKVIQPTKVMEENHNTIITYEGINAQQ